MSTVTLTPRRNHDIETTSTTPRPKADDSLDHYCRVHYDPLGDKPEVTEACKRNEGCVSYCGLDLTDVPYVDDDGFEASCIVCTHMADERWERES